MSEIYIKFTQDITQEEYEDKPYGDWWEQWRFSVDSVNLSDSASLNVEKYNLPDIDVGDEVYVVCLRYSDGDSFGYSQGKGEIVWAFKSKVLAEGLVNIIKIHKDEVNFSFINDCGEDVKLSNPAFGYFECLDDVYIETFIVEE